VEPVAYPSTALERIEIETDRRRILTGRIAPGATGVAELQMEWQ
jgi:hypothetical protein